MDQNEALNSINSDLIRGHIDTIILKALQAGDRYGYDIIKEIEHKSDGQYVIKQPTLYSCLKRLEVQGFVKSYWGSKSIGGRKKYFTLTDLGRELFVRNKSDWDYSRSVIDKLISDEVYVPYTPEQLEEQQHAQQATDEQPQEVQKPTTQSEPELLAIETVSNDEDEDDEEERPTFETATYYNDDEDEYDLKNAIDVQPLEIEDYDDLTGSDETSEELEEDADRNELEVAYVEPYKNDYDLDEEYDRRQAEEAAQLRNDDDEDEEYEFYDAEAVKEAESSVTQEPETAENIEEPEVQEPEVIQPEAIQEAAASEAELEPTLEPTPAPIEEAQNDNEIINGDSYISKDAEELPLLTFDQDTVESFASEVDEEEQAEAPLEPIQEEAEAEEELPPLSVSEQNLFTEGLPSEINEEHHDFVNETYYAQDQESYLDNVDNAKYEPPQNNEVTNFDFNNFNNYFEDIEEEEEEVASAEPIITPPLYELPKPEFPDIRKFTRETPSENKTVFFSYNKRSDLSLDERDSVIDKEYRSVISKLISDNIVASVPPIPPEPKPIQYNEVWEENEPPQLPPQQPQQQQQQPPTISLETDRPPTIYEIEQQEERQNSDARAIGERITAETGDNIELRTHSDNALKAYNNKHYYYCNKLRLLQYGILFGIMLLEIVLCFYAIEVVHNSMNISNASLAVYIAAVVIAAIFPITAFFMASSDYNKRKRINYSGKTSAIFSIVVTVLLALIVFFANVYGGILINDFNNYLSTLIMPIVLSTNVLVNALIFHLLYTSGRYNVQD